MFFTSRVLLSLRPGGSASIKKKCYITTVHRDLQVLMPSVILLQSTLTFGYLTWFRPWDTVKCAVSSLDCHCVLDTTLVGSRCHTRRTKEASLFFFFLRSTLRSFVQRGAAMPILQLNSITNPLFQSNATAKAF